MKLETKFNLGDTVYPISKGVVSVWKNCTTCEGKSEVTIKESNAKITCPKCYGRGGSRDHVPTEWGFCWDSVGKIGKIDIEKYAKKYTSQKSKTAYMLDSTGVGSGTCWNESSLFSTKKEAEAECKRLNDLNQ